jgi:glycosyltransferase involved in cell wall biosynthesis
MRHLRILIVHNAYQQRGGEDTVVEAEIALLRKHGHNVFVYARHNDDLQNMCKLEALADTLWSIRTINDLNQLISNKRPNLIHAHNTFPLISPSLYWAANRAGVPVVQTLHNFRLLCLQAMLLRDGRVCEDCIGYLPWRGVVHRCYRGSILQSGAVAGMLALHRWLGTYCNKVTRYIALNNFCRDKFIEGGLTAGQITVKPNFVDIQAPDFNNVRRGMLFVGRLSREKGITVLAEAARRLPNISFTVIGAGPDQDRLTNLANVNLIGFQDQETVRAEMCRTACLVLPSLWYENFPRTLVEAFACGLPVIASRLGAMAELIEEGRTGLLFEPGSAVALSEKIAWAESHSDVMSRMGEAARAEYELKYSPEINYRQLMAIYQTTIA